MSIYSTPTKVLHRTAIRCAAWLVPQRHRSEWLQEWTAELWYVQEACIPEGSPSWVGEREVAAFCLGAFKDSFYVGRTVARQRSKGMWHKAHLLASARRCALFLMALATVAGCLSLCLPGVRTAVQPLPYRDARDLVMISSDGRIDDAPPTVRVDQFRSMRDRSQHIFSDFAFYQISVKLLRTDSHKSHELSHELSIARSSSNLFDLLGLTIRFASSQSVNEDLPALILSETLWRSAFHSDTHIIGQTLKLGLRSVKVVGILADGSWQLPGKIDAWLLEPDVRAAAIPATTRGYVIARSSLSSPGTAPTAVRNLVIPQVDGPRISFECVSVADRTQGPLGIFAFTLFLALLSLPAITSLLLGEYPASSHDLPWHIKLRRWLFLGSKVALILPIVYFGSLDIAHCNTAINPATSECLQGISSFIALLFAFRWILHDQRKRCPVCLRLLTNPARVGQPSRNFLAWNGTELICAGGHGLLHVPEITTSWFSVQRWLYLDPSWEGLFTETTLVSTGTL
jgi:hypothetical protein